MSRSKSRPINSMTRERLVAPVAAGEEEELLVDGRRKRKAGGSSSSISAASVEPESKSTTGGLKSISNSNLRTLSSMSSFASLSHAVATNVVVNKAETSSLAGLNQVKPPASMSLNELTAAIRSSLDKTNIATTGITSESESKEGKLGKQLLINCF